MKRLLTHLLRYESLLLILFANIMLRIPNLFEPYWYGDEGIYLTLGNGLRSGLVLYRDIIDHKTPIIYLLAIVPSQFWFKLLLLVWSCASVALFYFLAKKLLRGEFPVIVSTTVFMLATTLPFFEGNIANGELFVMGFVLAGFFMLSKTSLFAHFFEQKPTFRVQYWHMVATGVLFSLGILTKVPAVFDLAAVGLVCVFTLCRFPTIITFKKLFFSGIAFTAGLALPILLSIAYFASQNALAEYVQFGLMYNFRYSSEFTLPFTNPLLRFMFSSVGKALFLALAALALAVKQKQLRPQFQFVAGWFFLTLFAALLSSRPYPHYALQVFPPLALALGLMMEKGKKGEKVLAGSLLVLAGSLIAIFVGTMVVFRFGLYNTLGYYQNFLALITKRETTQQYRQRFSGLVNDTYDAALYIQKTTQPDQRMFIWGTNPMLYALSKRNPAGRFTVSFHIKDFHAYDETFDAIQRIKPQIVVIMRDENGPFDAFYLYVNTHYTLAKELPTMRIYQNIEK